jgi:alcohol dehydrogenase (cytochrome c)
VLRRGEPRRRHLGDTLFMGTLDAHLVAIDAKNGKPLWNKEVADDKFAYSITVSPLVVKDKVIIGVGGAEYGIRGFVAAYDAKTGREVWRFYTIPGKGEPGIETWSGDAHEHGGGSIWVTGSYDPALNLTYWGVGNPGRTTTRISARATTCIPIPWCTRCRHGQAEMALPVHAE